MLLLLVMKKFEIKLHRRNIPKGEFVTDLRRVANLIGRPSVTGAIYDEKGKFGRATILRRFGSWNRALDEAGLKVIHTLNNTEDVLFENIADVWQKLGRQPVGREMEKSVGQSKFSIGTYEKRFGSWNKALQSFGEYINNSVSQNRCSQNELKVKAKSSLKRSPRRIN